MLEKTFLIIMMTFAIAAAGIYIYDGNYAKTLFWISVAFITFATLLM
mgnify:CR=1 FL=1